MDVVEQFQQVLDEEANLIDGMHMFTRTFELKVLKDELGKELVRTAIPFRQVPKEAVTGWGVGGKGGHFECYFMIRVPVVEQKFYSCS